MSPNLANQRNDDQERLAVKVGLIAFSAPPKGAPESFQVHRVLHALDPSISVVLVNTPAKEGWERIDKSLHIPDRTELVEARMPMHVLVTRVLEHRYLKRFHVPDNEFWTAFASSSVVRAFRADPPDVLYSRSSPFSTASFALALHRRLGIPWVMHLSDPWHGSPYRSGPAASSKADRELEAECFGAAAAITLTTSGQAAFYRQRYPEHASKISIVPNVMPDDELAPMTDWIGCRSNEPLRIVYTGALYGARTIKPVLAAIEAMPQGEAGDLPSRLRLDVYGNAMPDQIAAMEANALVRYHGAVSQEKAREAQRGADLLLVIEPEIDHPLRDHFLPSKLLDYLHTGTPVLALTPRDSETARLCAQGGGWAFVPSSTPEITRFLREAIERGVERPQTAGDGDFRAVYRPSLAAAALTQLFNATLGGKA